MTVFETWVTQTVANLVRDMREEAAPDYAGLTASPEQQRSLRDQHNRAWDDLERRAAILLVQARALECRHVAAELQINNGNNPAARQVAKTLMDRSSKLEAIGMMLAKGPWPIQEKDDAPRLQVVTH